MSGRSSCPECGTILRVRDRSFVGRRVSCPDCKTALRIATEDDHGDFVARRLTPDELASSVHPDQDRIAASKDKTLLPLKRTHSFVKRLVESPLTAAWLLAIAISALIAVVALAPKHRFIKAPPKPLVTDSEQSVDSLPEPDVLLTRPQDPSKDIIEIPPSVAPTNTNDAANLPVSALEPVNLDGPLPVPPVAAMVDAPPELRPEATPLPARIDVETKLKQELVSYKQSKPVSRRDLIDALQEHLGASILYDSKELGVTELDKTITFEIENTTVGGLIKKVADGAGWEIKIEENGIRLTRP